MFYIQRENEGNVYNIISKTVNVLESSKLNMKIHLRIMTIK